MEYLSVFISEYFHVSLHFDIVCSQPVYSPLQLIYLIILCFVGLHEMVDLHLHAIEVMHELGNTG